MLQEKNLGQFEFLNFVFSQQSESKQKKFIENKCQNQEAKHAIKSEYF